MQETSTDEQILSPDQIICLKAETIQRIKNYQHPLIKTITFKIHGNTHLGRCNLFALQLIESVLESCSRFNIQEPERIFKLISKLMDLEIVSEKKFEAVA